MLKQGISHRNEECKLQYMKGDVFLILKDYKEALKAFSRAVNLKPAVTKYEDKKRFALRKLGDVDKLKETLKYYIQHNSEATDRKCFEKMLNSIQQNNYRAANDELRAAIQTSRNDQRFANIKGMLETF